MAAGSVSYGGKSQVTSTTASTVTKTISTGSTCELVVASIIVTGTSALTTTVTFGGVDMIQVGAIVATTEGSVQMWYTVTNTNSRSSVPVSYKNKNGYTNSCMISWYNSSGTLVLSDNESGFSTSGQSAQLNLVNGLNNGFAAVDVWHSGYSTLTGTTKNRSVLYDEDRGTLIASSQYGIGTGTASYPMLHSTPSSDDWAMIAASWVDNTTQAFASANTVTYADVSSIDGVLRADIGTADDVLF